MTPSPDPHSDRKRLSADELIAVFVALTSIGAIFLWSMSQKDGGLHVPFIQALTASRTPMAAPAATPTAMPSASALPAVTPSTQRTSGQAASGQAASSQAASGQATTDTPSPSIAPPSNPGTPTAQTVPFVAIAPQAPAPQPAPVAPTTPAAPTAPAAQPKQFTDVPANFWASAPIAALSAKGILDGFPDGSFQPNKPITRAEFAEVIRRAFNQPAKRSALTFSDLKPDYWAIAAINQATQTQFMSGFPNGTFQPDRQIPRLQMLLALATGLNLQPKSPAAQVLSQYQDADEVPKYAVDRIAAAIEAGVVVNDDKTKRLKPEKVATRAEAAALVYAALGNATK